MGIYIFTKNILKKMFDEGAGDDFGKDIIPIPSENIKH
jgi:glucose-1-phosphate adenylyltransferase